MGMYDNDIALMAADLSIGERSDHLVCPACQGGAANERSLLIWSDPGKLAYKCFRVKCGISGCVGDSGFRKTVNKKRNPKKLVSELRPTSLPDDVVEWLCEDRFPWLTRDMLYLNNVLWDDCIERVLIPIVSLTGFEEGLLARKYPELMLDPANNRGPKASAYFRHMPEDYALTSLIRTRDCVREDYMVVYEDFWSALRSNEFIPSCALSGTSVHESALLNIIKAGIKRVVFVLDADAVAKAAKLVQTNTLLFHSVSYVPLSGKDPKDMTRQEMRALITEIEDRLHGESNTGIGHRK